MNRPFVHCHLHTGVGSILDGMTKIPDLCKRVKELGMGAVAITDHGSIAGALQLISESKKSDILPIVGIEAYCAPFRRDDHTPGGHSGKEHAFHLTLLAQNAEGFRNLIRLSSLAFLEGFYYKPRIDREILARHSAGLICLSGCVSSEFSDHVLNRKPVEAAQLASWYNSIFPGRFFVEIQCNGIQIQRDHEQAATDLANKMGLPLVATSDAHYLNQADAPAHDILLCVNTGRTVNDPTRMRFDNDQFFVRSPEQMYAALPHHHEALARTAEIAATVEPYYESFGIGKRQFPSFSTPPQHTAETYLRELCEQGLKLRYPDGITPAITGRLNHELTIINQMGFASYFLIVWDFVRYARENDIPTTARGSGCGAIVAYLLFISHVDPLQFDLLFERFLDPSRSEAPDIDIDLCKSRRAEVIEYVRAKYGNVAKIGTFGTMLAKSAIKDVGRALNIPLPKVERITSLIPGKPGTKLGGSIESIPELAAFARNPEYKTLFDFAMRLEGTARSIGTHAAGVVIADQPLFNLVPLQRIPKTDTISTQWEMGDIEAAGLLKMDFLGSRNMTMLGKAVELIRRHTPSFDAYALPLDDPATFALLQRGEARGVFQLDGAGIRDLLVKMKPDRFGDIVAILALYRPGPIEGGMVDQYVNVKHGRQTAEYAHPVMREVLEKTYGVLSYQEQVMFILNRLGSIELTQSYACIKAISKKKLDSVQKFRDKFLSGSIANGLTSAQAESIWKLIEVFAGYAFNLAHATSYAQIAYQTAFIKANYPSEFAAALLSSEMDGSEREKYFVPHVADARRMGLSVATPDVNLSEMEFVPDSIHPTTINFGLAAIKGIGRPTFARMLSVRAAGPFTSLDDLARRIGPDFADKTVLNTLIESGAFDSLGNHRSQHLSVVERVLTDLRRSRKKIPGLQTDMFAMLSGATLPPPLPITLPDIPELPEADRLAREKSALGFYLSGHPLRGSENLIRNFSTHALADLDEVPESTDIILGGLVTNITGRAIKQRDGEMGRMARFVLETPDGPIGAIVWPSQYATLGPMLAEDSIIFAHGNISRNREPADLILSRVTPINQACHLVRGVVVVLNAAIHGPKAAEALYHILGSFPGKLYLFIETLSVTKDGKRKRTVLRAGPDHRVSYNPELFARLIAEFGEENIKLVGASGAIAYGERR